MGVPEFGYKMTGDMYETDRDMYETDEFFKGIISIAKVWEKNSQSLSLAVMRQEAENDCCLPASSDNVCLLPSFLLLIRLE